MRNLRRHANTFAQCGVRVDGFANVHGVSAHLNCQGDFADHVARMRADHAATQKLAVESVEDSSKYFGRIGQFADARRTREGPRALDATGPQFWT